MDGESALEKSIKEFVFSKTNEEVYLDISKSNIVSVKRKSKAGSVALAMFWLRVFRHQNNYPMPKYPYKELYDKQGNNKVILKVDTVTLTVFMSTGTVMIQGNLVIDWFLNHFPSIMAHYDAPVGGPQPKIDVHRQYIQKWEGLEADYSIKKANEDAETRLREDKALGIVTDTVQEVLQVQEDDLLARGDYVGVIREETDDKLDDLAEEIELLSIDRWPVSTIKEQLNKLRTCCVRDGSTYIYRLWKSLLHSWFSDPDSKVYLVTPFLDASRLAEICQIILQHKNEASLDAFYVRQQCDRERKIHEVKQDALKLFKDANDKMFIEYKIFQSIIYPTKRFHAKFMACVKSGEAQVVVTSANFHGDHFEHSNMETVQFLTMSEAKFIKDILGPINSSVKVQK